MAALAPYQMDGETRSAIAAAQADDDLAAVLSMLLGQRVTPPAPPPRVRGDGAGKNFSADLPPRDPADPDYLPWPEDWFQPDPSHWARCRALWGEVFLVSLKDALRDAAGVGLASPANGNYRNTATVHWIGSAGFHQVAELAGLDGRAAADRLRVIMADPVALQAALERLGHNIGKWDRGNGGGDDGS